MHKGLPLIKGNDMTDTKQQFPHLHVDRADAVAEAEEIGCEGAHSHELPDGSTVFMACATHAEAVELLGEDPLDQVSEERSGHEDEEEEEKRGDEDEEEEKACGSYERGSMTLKFDIKSLEVKKDETGEFATFKGYASTFGNTDLGNDVVMKGAFTKSLDRISKLKNGIPLLIQHDTTKVAGRITDFKLDEKGLLVEPRVNLGVQDAREALSLMRAGDLSDLSMGFVIVDSEFNKKTGVRELKEVDLKEISIVTFPANEEAKITEVKDDEDKDKDADKGSASPRKGRDVDLTHIDLRFLEKFIKSKFNLTHTKKSYIIASLKEDYKKWYYLQNEAKPKPDVDLQNALQDGIADMKKRQNNSEICDLSSTIKKLREQIQN